MEKNPNHKIINILFLLSLLSLIPSRAGSAADCFPRSSGLTSQICIARLEEQGILNIYETRIVLDDQQAFILVGGQAVCAYVYPGNHFIYAKSYDPYDPASKDPGAWSSNRIEVQVGDGDRLEFELRKAQTNQNNQWSIEPCRTEGQRP
jgi:hypothetical protein